MFVSQVLKSLMEFEGCVDRMSPHTLEVVRFVQIYSERGEIRTFSNLYTKASANRGYVGRASRMVWCMSETDREELAMRHSGKHEHVINCTARPSFWVVLRHGCPGSSATSTAPVDSCTAIRRNATVHSIGLRHSVRGPYS